MNRDVRLGQEKDPCDSGAFTEMVHRTTEHGCAAFMSGLLEPGPNSLDVSQINIGFNIYDQVQTCWGYLCH